MRVRAVGQVGRRPGRRGEHALPDSTFAGDGAVMSGAGTVSPHDTAEPDEERDSERPFWHRVVLKLSGAAFSGSAELGIDPDVVLHCAREITDALRLGVQVAV